MLSAIEKIRTALLNLENSVGFGDSALTIRLRAAAMQQLREVLVELEHKTVSERQQLE